MLTFALQGKRFLQSISPIVVYITIVRLHLPALSGFVKPRAMLSVALCWSWSLRRRLKRDVCMYIESINSEKRDSVCQQNDKDYQVRYK